MTAMKPQKLSNVRMKTRVVLRDARMFPPVRRVLKLLERTYPPSRLGNKQNPLDELVYVLLSLQTNESRYHKVYRSFKKRFPRWSLLLEASIAEIADAIVLGGLGRQKALHLKRIVQRLQDDFGEVSLRSLVRYKTDEAERYLCSLPGVGIKTARCVLMYSFGRMVFPADVHCLRVMDRLGWIEWRGQRSEMLAEPAQAIVPRLLREALHVRLIQHGRSVCRSTPRCNQCVLRSLCPCAKATRN
jgi:endonuclease III